MHRPRSPSVLATELVKAHRCRPSDFSTRPSSLEVENGERITPRLEVCVVPRSEELEPAYDVVWPELESSW